jgi:hypothetical protein
MSDTDARIENFLLDAFSDYGNNSCVVSENTGRRLAELEERSAGRRQTSARKTRLPSDAECYVGYGW